MLATYPVLNQRKAQARYCHGAGLLPLALRRSKRLLSDLGFMLQNGAVIRLAYEIYLVLFDPTADCHCANA